MKRAILVVVVVFGAAQALRAAIAAPVADPDARPKRRSTSG